MLHLIDFNNNKSKQMLNQTSQKLPNEKKNKQNLPPPPNPNKPQTPNVGS